MILDLAKDDLQGPAPDIIVIGAGAVGITLSVDLARNGKRVLLCESGGRGPEAASQRLNEALVTGRPHDGVTDGRARVLGGTTTLWGGQLIAFRSIDFESRPWLGLDKWPIALGDLQPYYDQFAAMAKMPLSGASDEDIWQALGLSPPDLGNDLEFVLTRWLREPNLARVFGDELANNPNLTVLLHAAATGFSADATGRITGTRLRSPDGKTIDVAADSVVISTGTIEASRLMLAAAHDDPSLPWSGNRMVGVAFQDHLDMRVASVEPMDRKRFHDAFDNIFLNGFKYNPKIALAADVQRQDNLTNIGGVFTFESSVSQHLANIKIFVKALRNGVVRSEITKLPGALIALGRIWWPLIVRYLKDNRAFNPADLGITLRVHCEQRPLEQSRITIDPARRDANGVPLANLHWAVDGRELAAIASFCIRLAERFEAIGLARLTIDSRILANDPSVLDDCRDTNHHCGGLQMSDTPETGVVDADLRVHGTGNLYVAGAAVYPSSSFANPTFTALALALRLSDHLRKPR